MIDLHCHLLPGVDDGARDLPMALEMARGLRSLGFRSVACTPHVPWVFATPPAELQAIQAQLGRALAESSIALELFRGGEHDALDVPELLSKSQLICFSSSKCFLMELPLSGLSTWSDELLFRIQIAGLRPVIAHVERLPDVQKDVRVLERLRARGASLLVNLGSLGGSERVLERTAQAVIAAGFADAVSTDLHAPEDLDEVARGLERLLKQVGPEQAERMLTDAPAAIAGIPLPRDTVSDDGFQKE